jgi:hypothetical protein
MKDWVPAGILIRSGQEGPPDLYQLGLRVVNGHLSHLLRKGFGENIKVSWGLAFSYRIDSRYAVANIVVRLIMIGGEGDWKGVGESGHRGNRIRGELLPRSRRGIVKIFKSVVNNWISARINIYCEGVPRYLNFFRKYRNKRKVSTLYWYIIGLDG